MGNELVRGLHRKKSLGAGVKTPAEKPWYGSEKAKLRAGL